MIIHELSKVDGFAEITADYLLDGLEKMYPEMEQLLDLNKIKIKMEEKIMSSNKLAGLSFCVTGKLEHFDNRAQAEELTNSTEETTKYKTARDQEGTNIITEQQLLDMIDE